MRPISRNKLPHSFPVLLADCYAPSSELKNRLSKEKNPLRNINSEFVNRSEPNKYWTFFSGFGGSSNCWWAATSRLMPEDFKLKSMYGVGANWPLDYDELEPFYCDAEEIMQVSGDSNELPYPRSRPYPQPPHRESQPDKVLKAAFPDKSEKAVRRLDERFLEKVRHSATSESLFA